ncbi:MAG: hypothetical protein IJX91_03520 [Clostridia bacterium]|nr:hypothetical protein [Clostridia bacterium]
MIIPNERAVSATTSSAVALSTMAWKRSPDSSCTVLADAPYFIVKVVVVVADAFVFAVIPPKEAQESARIEHNATKKLRFFIT